MENFWKIDWSGVISAAAESELGIIALVVIVLSVLVFLLFGSSHSVAKLMAFAMLIVGILSMGFLMQRDISFQLDQLAIEDEIKECLSQAEIRTNSCRAYDRSGFESSPSGSCSLEVQAGEDRFFPDLKVQVTSEGYRNISGSPADQAVKPEMKTVDGISVPVRFTGTIGCTNARGTGRTCESKATIQAASFPVACVEHHKALRR